MCFPVIANKFPVRLKFFPVPSLREYAKFNEQCQHVTRKFEANFGCICKYSLFFPCLSGKSPLRPQRRVRSRLPAPPPSQAQCAESPAGHGDWRNTADFGPVGARSVGGETAIEGISRRQTTFFSEGPFRRQLARGRTPVNLRKIVRQAAKPRSRRCRSQAYGR